MRSSETHTLFSFMTAITNSLFYYFSFDHLCRQLSLLLLLFWVDISVTRLGPFWTWGNFLKPLATISLPKFPTFLGNFCKDVKIYHYSMEFIFGQLLKTFGDFFLVTLVDVYTFSVVK